MNRAVPLLRSNHWQGQRGVVAPTDPAVLVQEAAGRDLTATAWEGAGSSKRLSRIQVAILIFLCWTAVGIFQAASEMLTSPAAWRGNLLDKVFDAWVWAMLTPALVFIDRKLAAKQTSVIRSIALLLVLSVPVTFINTYITAVLLYPFPEVWWSPLRNPGYVVFYFLGGWATYVALIGILQAFRFYNSYLKGQLQLERVQKSLLKSRLDALRLHLEPHFLFNTLNAISSELGDNPKLARDMIGDLGALLRQSLDCKDSAQVSLARELSVLEHYLTIQRVRFGDRIAIRVNAEPEMLQVGVPSMLLQPLVENAIRHGIEGRTSGGTILVSAKLANDRLEIRVIDDGVGLPRGWKLDSAAGHGIRVTRERLAALYPETAEDCFSIRRRPTAGTEVVVRIPLSGGIQNGSGE